MISAARARGSCARSCARSLALGPPKVLHEERLELLLEALEVVGRAAGALQQLAVERVVAAKAILKCPQDARRRSHPSQRVPPPPPSVAVRPCIEMRARQTHLVVGAHEQLALLGHRHVELQIQEEREDAAGAAATNTPPPFSVSVHTLTHTEAAAAPKERTRSRL